MLKNDLKNVMLKYVVSNCAMKQCIVNVLFECLKICLIEIFKMTLKLEEGVCI